MFKLEHCDFLTIFLANWLFELRFLINLSYKKACILQFNSMEHLLPLVSNYFILHNLEIGVGFGKKMLIHSIKSTCK